MLLGLSYRITSPALGRGRPPTLGRPPPAPARPGRRAPPPCPAPPAGMPAAMPAHAPAVGQERRETAPLAPAAALRRSGGDTGAVAAAAEPGAAGLGLGFRGPLPGHTGLQQRPPSEGVGFRAPPAATAQGAATGGPAAALAAPLAATAEGAATGGTAAAAAAPPATAASRSPPASAAQPADEQPRQLALPASGPEGTLAASATLATILAAAVPLPPPAFLRIGGMAPARLRQQQQPARITPALPSRGLSRAAAAADAGVAQGGMPPSVGCAASPAPAPALPALQVCPPAGPVRPVSAAEQQPSAVSLTGAQSGTPPAVLQGDSPHPDDNLTAGAAASLAASISGANADCLPGTRAEQTAAVARPRPPAAAAAAAALPTATAAPPPPATAAAEAAPLAAVGSVRPDAAAAQARASTAALSAADRIRTPTRSSTEPAEASPPPAAIASGNSDDAGPAVVQAARVGSQGQLASGAEVAAPPAAGALPPEAAEGAATAEGLAAAHPSPASPVAAVAYDGGDRNTCPAQAPPASLGRTPSPGLQPGQVASFPAPAPTPPDKGRQTPASLAKAGSGDTDAEAGAVPFAVSQLSPAELPGTAPVPGECQPLPIRASDSVLTASDGAAVAAVSAAAAAAVAPLPACNPPAALPEEQGAVSPAERPHFIAAPGPGRTAAATDPAAAGPAEGAAAASAQPAEPVGAHADTKQTSSGTDPLKVAHRTLAQLLPPRKRRRKQGSGAAPAAPGTVPSASRGSMHLPRPDKTFWSVPLVDRVYLQSTADNFLLRSLVKRMSLKGFK